MPSCPSNDDHGMMRCVILRGIDTACQPKHYDEVGVGSALAACDVPREELYLQTKCATEQPMRLCGDATLQKAQHSAHMVPTLPDARSHMNPAAQQMVWCASACRFTPLSGQDPNRVPYDAEASLEDQAPASQPYCST